MPDNGLIGLKRAQIGFTIIEMMIVLAVSGFMLLGAILVVAGQQRKVEFSQAVLDIKTSVEQTISDVGSGYYPNPGGFRCSASGGNVSISTGTSVQQGSNTGCIFMGKAIQFGVADSDPQNYVVHTIAGLQSNAGTLMSARPVAVDLDTARDTKSLRNGLRAVRMYYEQGGITRDVSTISFISSLGDRDASDQLVSGGQQVMVVPVEGSGNVSNTTTVPAVVGAINTQLRNSPANPPGGVKVCFSNDNLRSALMTIGKSGSSLAVRMDYKNTGDCS